MASPQGDSRLGTRFGPYELQQLIGVGGMGEVYRAYDTVRERMVAVKLLRAEMAADKSYQERFRRESRVAARLQEPHVIPVHDFGDIDGTLYIDMRLVEGASLKDELRANGPLEPKRAASIITQVGAALDAAHSDKLIHRDIKPENVLLTPDDFAYLVDFGIAHAGGDASVTSTGLIIGSCAYMAAERFAGGQVGPAARHLLIELSAVRMPHRQGAFRDGRGFAAADDRAHVLAAAAAEHDAARDHAGIRRRDREGDGEEAVGQVRVGGGAGEGGDDGCGFGSAVSSAASRADSADEHQTVLRGLRESVWDGLHAVSAWGARARATAAAVGSEEAAVRPDAGGTGGGDGAAVRRGGDPGVGADRRRRRHRADATDVVGRAAEHDDGDHDGAVGRQLDELDDDHVIAVIADDQRGAAGGHDRYGRPGLRRAHDALRCRREPGGGDPDVAVDGGDL